MRKQAVIEVFYFDAGGGHRNALNALTDVLGERFPLWRVKGVDLQELLEPVDWVHKITQKISPGFWRMLKPVAPEVVNGPYRSQEMYNTALKHGKTRGARAMLVVLQRFIESKASEIENLLRLRWRNPENEEPDLVISLIPNFNRFIFNALNAILPRVPFVTIMTDMIDIPPHFWMEDQDQFLICGTKTAYDQALNAMFYDPEKVFDVSGMILKKCFYDRSDGGTLTHRDIGLSPHLPTALIMFGGNGSLVSEKIVAQVQEAKLGVQTIVICGHNRDLYESLQGKPNCHAVGFVSNVPDYMRLADIFIGKPGPGSISEAIHMGCPVIVEHNAATLPQERPNVDWILEKGVGVAVKSFKRGMARAVRDMMGDLELYRENIRNNVPENRAVYEIADILASIVESDSLSLSGVTEKRFVN